MSNTKDQIAARIASKGIRAEDIKFSGRLTDDQIAGLDFKLVYLWVRTGEWKQKDFFRWLEVLRVLE